MKTVAMHQPHYFPWLGYLDKMAKADEFVVLDEVQFEDGSPMSRNRFLQVDGEAKLLSLSVEKKGYLEKPTRDVRLSNWPKTRKKHRGFIDCNYRKTPYFDEVMPLVAKVVEADCDTLLVLDMASIEMLGCAYGIETPLVLQSSLPYDIEAKNNDLVLGLCRVCGADVYLSGRGARAYMDDRSFAEKGIAVRYQEFSYPEYPQYRQSGFVPNLSALDPLFQCGIDGARRMFNENMRKEMIP